MYGYLGSKTKSYWILKGFLLLFIFYVFWPYKASLLCFLVFWLYKVGLPCFFAFRSYKAGLLCFLICFPFYWKLLGLCSRADRVPKIPWIITECLAINLMASDFCCSDRINHSTKSMCKMLWKCWYPTVPYLLHSASHTIGHFQTWGIIWSKL